MDPSNTSECVGCILRHKFCICTVDVVSDGIKVLHFIHSVIVSTNVPPSIWVPISDKPLATGLCGMIVFT